MYLKGGIPLRIFMNLQYNNVHDERIQKIIVIQSINQNGH